MKKYFLFIATICIAISASAIEKSNQYFSLTDNSLKFTFTKVFVYNKGVLEELNEEGGYTLTFSKVENEPKMLWVYTGEDRNVNSLFKINVDRVSIDDDGYMISMYFAFAFGYPLPAVQIDFTGALLAGELSKIIGKENFDYMKDLPRVKIDTDKIYYFCCPSWKEQDVFQFTTDYDKKQIKDIISFFKKRLKKVKAKGPRYSLD